MATAKSVFASKFSGMQRPSSYLRRIAVIIAICLAPSIATAQDQDLYGGSAKLNSDFPYVVGRGIGAMSYYNFDCSVNFDSSKGIKIGGKKHRRLVRDAADRAIAAGYNYALVRPLRSQDQQDYNDVVKYGFGQAEKVTQGGAVYKKAQFPCEGLDDLKTASLLFDKSIRARLADNETLVDLRALRMVADGKSPSRNPVPPPLNVSERHFERPGERERLTPMLPLMARAIHCRTDLVPISVSELATPASLRDKALEAACLEALKPDAAAVGWTALTTVPDKDEGRGYSMSSSSASSNSAVNVSGARPADAREWGEGWTDISERFPTFDGILMTRPDGARSLKVLVASSTASDDEMMDYAIYTAAQFQLPKKYNSVRVMDFNTDQFEKMLGNTRQRLLDKGQTIGPDTLSQSLAQSKMDARQGFFRARELHSKARLFSFQFGNNCSPGPNDLACGDKISVINAVGPRLQDTEYIFISTPAGYRPAN